jgi:hypothetical protein
VTRANIVAALGGAVGWFATFSFAGAASGFAAIATGVFMVVQTYFLIRRQRCTMRDCRRRKS